ncbi:MAG: 50S ribosomal protein L11 methyltransferase [Gammaproteobacteria bacterium]
MSAWLQLSLEVARTDIDSAEELLYALDALSITELDAQDQPLLEPGPGETPLWDRVVVVALFPGDLDPDELRAVFASAWQTAFGENPPGFRVEGLADQPWERAWLEHFKPMRFGERLWVVPSWTEPPQPDAVNLRLDPGLAFGTGTHQTTALCLRWLDAQGLAGKRVLDFGCGSGILAIAAALLGAREVVGVDNDPQAIIATGDNAGRNHVTVRALLPREFEADATAGNAAFDFVVANILAGPLVQLAPRIAGCVKPGGGLALSGILREQADEVAAAYAGWIDWDAPAIDGDWVRLAGRRR